MIPVPSINPPPGPVEVEARALHAATCRMETPDVADGEILDAWDALPDDGRQWLLDAAQKRIEARLAEPGKPDDVEALTQRLTGIRLGDCIRFSGGGEDCELVVTSQPDAAADGTVVFTAADADLYERTERLRALPGLSLGEQRHPAEHCDRGGLPHLGPCVQPGARTARTFTDEWPDEAPEHRAARQRTDEERAALTEFTVSHWAASIPVAYGTCGTCGQPVVYNLAAKVVGHTAGAINPCEWPWPGEPMPAGVKAQFQLVRRLSADVDRALAALPTAHAPALGIGDAR